MDRYELYQHNVNDLRKVLTQVRKIEAQAAKVVTETTGLGKGFIGEFVNRPTRKEATVNKHRLVNEIMRSSKNIERVDTIIKADIKVKKQLEDWGMTSDLADRQRFGEMMEVYRSLKLSNIIPSDQIVDLFELGNDAWDVVKMWMEGKSLDNEDGDT